MKKVSLEDVEEHFKNAKTIRNRYNKEFEFTGVASGLWGSFRDLKSGFTIYDENGGFAEIITIKE